MRERGAARLAAGIVAAGWFATPANAEDLVGGDFEGPPPGAGWSAIFLVAPVGPGDPPGLATFGGGVDHEGRVGDDPATGAIGREPSGIRQSFSCFVAGLADPHCTVTFDAEHLGGTAGAGETAKAQLDFAGGSDAFEIPGSALGESGRYKISLAACPLDTTLTFWIDSEGGDPPGLTSRLLIDDVECECVEGDQSTLEPIFVDPWFEGAGVVERPLGPPKVPAVGPFSGTILVLVLLALSVVLVRSRKTARPS